ncbi:MAG: GLUG motif-containing protein, partial [Candidatus Onthovivens sp.]|nr:GLUG motif-containing protein [Candidatus Onthovivens sp.]
NILVNTGSLVEGTNSYVGGFVGHSGEGSTSYTNCRVENLNVKSPIYVGGFMGILHYGNIVDNCHVVNSTVTKTITAEAELNITKKYSIGGIAGVHGTYEQSATIKNSSFTGTLVNTCDPATDWSTVHSGLVGLCYNSSTPYVENLDIYTNNYMNGALVVDPSAAEGE